MPAGGCEDIFWVFLCRLYHNGRAKGTFENGRGPKLHVRVRDLRGQLHGRRDHVHRLSGVAQREEDVPEQHQGAGSQAVQVLGVGHLQGFAQEPSGTKRS